MFLTVGEQYFQQDVAITEENNNQNVDQIFIYHRRLAVCETIAVHRWLLVSILDND